MNRRLNSINWVEKEMNFILTLYDFTNNLLPNRILANDFLLHWVVYDYFLNIFLL